ncbi:MAG TPA: GAF domain-containing protein, partial [Allocoleopsis sp.]
MTITHTQELNNFKRSLPLKAFTQLRNSFQQIVKMLGNTANLITEDILESVEVDEQRKQQKFSLIISEDFSGLLLAKNHNLSKNIEIEVILSTEKINTFVEELEGIFSNKSEAKVYFKKLRKTLAKQDNKIKWELTLILLEIMAESLQGEKIRDIDNQGEICQPLENALSQQIKQDQLLHQVTINISNSLELPIILETAVTQVREFLGVDRLVIYQFTSSGLVAEETGKITYEAKAADDIPTVMNFVEMETCFISQNECWEKYTKGFILTVEDVEKTFIFTPCLLASMRKLKIRAKIVVPIIVQSKLWGLLIAHQCFETRKWIEREQIFLQNIAEHLAIAIYQAQLYAELEQEKILLEKRVTERTRALYDSLMATEAANQAKSEFLATISHELRTPLTCVIGLSSTMLHWVFNPQSSQGKSHNLTLSIEKQREYLQTIHDSGEHLLELINNILELSQMEAGKAMLDISEFSLAKLAKETVKALEYKAKSKDVKLKIDLRLKSEIYQPEKKRKINGIWYDELELFLADETRIKQIILNLLNNGIKFTSKGGEVILRIWREDKDVVFQVEDTGIGISPDQLDLIFAKFQQLESAYQR